MRVLSTHNKGCLTYCSISHLMDKSELYPTHNKGCLTYCSISHLMDKSEFYPTHNRGCLTYCSISYLMDKSEFYTTHNKGCLTYCSISHLMNKRLVLIQLLFDEYVSTSPNILQFYVLHLTADVCLTKLAVIGRICSNAIYSFPYSL